MTKKEFKKLCFSNVYTGWNGHRTRINAFYFDYQQKWDENGKYLFGGYKFMIYADVKNCSKSQLFNDFYNWVTGKIQQPEYYQHYRYAETDEKRFKVSISL